MTLSRADGPGLHREAPRNSIESMRHHEEILKFDVMRRMKATREDIYHRNRYSRLARPESSIAARRAYS